MNENCESNCFCQFYLCNGSHMASIPLLHFSASTFSIIVGNYTFAVQFNLHNVLLTLYETFHNFVLNFIIFLTRDVFYLPGNYFNTFILVQHLKKSCLLSSFMRQVHIH